MPRDWPALPVYQSAADMPSLPAGWRAYRVENLYESLDAGRRYEQKTVLAEGCIPVLHQKAEGYLGFHNDKPGVVASIQDPVATFANHTCEMRLMVRPFSAIQNVFPMRGKTGLCLTRFLYYGTKGRIRLSEYKGHHPDFRRMWIGLPPLGEQQAIVEVLGALDDKIEADHQSVVSGQLLADIIFRRWRVGLSGQQATTFGQVADVYGGSTPKTEVVEYWNGNHAWAVPRDVTALKAPYLFDTERHITDAGLASIGNRVHPAGSIFMTSRATIGAFAVSQRPCAANQGFIVVVPKEAVFRWYLFHEMRSLVPELLDLANGSTFLEISRENFKGVTTVLPRHADLESLDRLLSPLHGWCASAMQEAARLAELRDILLPPLLSGELRVHDAKALVGGRGEEFRR